MTAAPQISVVVTPPKLFLQAMYAAFWPGSDPVHSAVPSAPPNNVGGVVSVMVKVNEVDVVSPHSSVPVKVTVIRSVQPVEVHAPSE